jgi:hypothetical protein
MSQIPTKAGGVANGSIRATGYIVALLALLPIGSQAYGQEARTRPFGEGTHTFRAILNQRGLEPISSERQFRNDVFGDAARMLVIVLGENREKQKESVLDRIPLAEGLVGFLRSGGAVLVATDRELCDWATPPQRGPRGMLRQRPTSIRVTGAFVQATEPESMYRGSPDCPFVQPLANPDVPIFDGLHRVATNRPSFLHLGSARWLRSLARLPHDCQLENNMPADGLRPFVFAAGGQVGDGRMLVLADHSVFINDMMLQTDNDNFDMACNAIDWLTEKTVDGERKRKRVLLVDDGAVVANFNVVLKEPPPLPMPGLPSGDELERLVGQLARGGQQRLGEMDRENLFNRLAVNALGGEGDARNHLILGLVVAGTFALLALAGLRLQRARQRIDLRLPVAGPELWQAPAATLPAQRQEALVQAGNFWEPARALARQFFERAAGLRPDSWTTAGRRPPQLPIADAAGQRRLYRTLWRLAISTAPYRVTAAEFQRLVPLVSGLQGSCGVAV